MSDLSRKELIEIKEMLGKALGNAWMTENQKMISEKVANYEKEIMNL